MASERGSGSKPPLPSADGDLDSREQRPGLEPRPNLEPVGDDAHPPQNRRMPTQPGLVLALDDEGATQREEPSPSPSPAGPLGVPPPPTLAPRHSPAPVRRGLFSSDRVTNLLAGAAIGLLIMILPAKRFAASYEEREVEPRIADLRGVLEHPLGVEAGLVEHPDDVAAEIHAGRRKVRRRYMALWLLVGLPVGLGIGMIPRPGD